MCVAVPLVTVADLVSMLGGDSSIVAQEQQELHQQLQDLQGTACLPYNVAAAVQRSLRALLTDGCICFVARHA